MTSEELLAALEPVIRAAVRAELRRCGFGPPAVGYLARWDADADCWCPVLSGPDEPQATLRA